MNRTLLLIAPLLLVAGCGDKPKGESAETSAEPSAAPTPEAHDIKLSAGKWQASSELVSMDIEGLPPELAKANIGQKTNFESCVTQAQADKPASDFFTNAKNTACQPQSYSMAGGKLNAVMTCEDKNTPGKMTLTIDGLYTPTTYDITSTMETTGGPAGGNMKVTAKTQGKRVGDCDAAPAKAG
jgi:hypothetical protein